MEPQTLEALGRQELRRAWHTLLDLGVNLNWNVVDHRRRLEPPASFMGMGWLVWDL